MNVINSHLLNRVSRKRFDKLFILVLINLYSYSSSGQELNTYTFGDYDFTEIKTNFPSSAVAIGFVNNIGIVKVKDESFFLVDTLGNSINPEGFDDMASDNTGKYFITEKDRKRGVINSKGQLVVPCLYATILLLEGTNIFQHGLCAVQDLDFKMGFIDTTGKVIIPIVYSRIINPKWIGGCHLMTLNNFLGIIDSLGNIVTPFKYKSLTHMNCGYALALDKKDNVVLINKKRVVKKLPYKNICYFPVLEGGFFDGLTGVQNGSGLWGYIDTCGNEIVKCQFDWITDFHNGFARVGKGQTSDTSKIKWGYINTKGDLISPIKYLEADNFENGLAKVKMTYSIDSFYYHYIDTSGKEINAFKYKNLGRIKCGAAIAQNNSWAENYKNNPKSAPCQDVILKMTGEEIVLDKEYCISGKWFSDGLITVDSNFLQGFVDTNGKVIVPCKYTFVTEFNNNYAWVQKEKDGCWYILKKKHKNNLKL